MKVQCPITTMHRRYNSPLPPCPASPMLEGHNSLALHCTSASMHRHLNALVPQCTSSSMYRRLNALAPQCARNEMPCPQIPRPQMHKYQNKLVSNPLPPRDVRGKIHQRHSAPAQQWAGTTLHCRYIVIGTLCAGDAMHQRSKVLEPKCSTPQYTGTTGAQCHGGALHRRCNWPAPQWAGAPMSWSDNSVARQYALAIMC